MASHLESAFLCLESLPFTLPFAQILGRTTTREKRVCAFPLSRVEITKTWRKAWRIPGNVQPRTDSTPISRDSHGTRSGAVNTPPPRKPVRNRGLATHRCYLRTNVETERQTHRAPRAVPTDREATLAEDRGGSRRIAAAAVATGGDSNRGEPSPEPERRLIFPSRGLRDTRDTRDARP